MVASNMEFLGKVMQWNMSYMHVVWMFSFVFVLFVGVSHLVYFFMFEYQIWLQVKMGILLWPGCGIRSSC